MMIIKTQHGPGFAVQVHIDSEPFLEVRHLLSNLNLQSLLPNESAEQENRFSKNALRKDPARAKFHGFCYTILRVGDAAAAAGF
jgi:hypothetical protein